MAKRSFATVSATDGAAPDDGPIQMAPPSGLHASGRDISVTGHVRLCAYKFLIQCTSLDTSACSNPGSIR